jgi:hypothetical protein
MTSKRDASPQRLIKETLFYEVDKIGNGWTVKKCERVADKWVHYGLGESPPQEQPIVKPFALGDLRKWLNRKYCDVPFVTAVFEYDIVAPSQIMLVVWVGMRKLKALPPRTITGIYTKNCEWPEQMTAAQYKKSQEF